MKQDLLSLWQSALGELEVELGKNNFSLYFKNSQLLELKDNVAKIGLPNKIVADQVNARYYSILQTILQKHTGQERLSLLFEIIQKPATGIQQPATSVGPLFTSPADNQETISEALKRARLRPDFTFDDFYVSTSNQLAFAAAQAVAKSPGKNYNPLFLWGGVGVGKTHLMQAVGHEMLHQNPRARIIYAPCEQFTNEIIEGIRMKNTKDFKDKYRSAQALLIDDVQFLSGKDTAQEEFFHTFNAVQQNEGQIILTSDRKPSDIKDIFDRLRSRFEGGMVADISTPDHELKTAICVLKAKKRGIELSNEVASLIASNVDNIRTLEGTLQKVITTAEIAKKPISPDLVSQVLNLPANSLPASEPNRLDARTILDTVCAFYELPIKLIKGEKRDKPIVLPRQILMYLLKKNTAMTYIEIADFLGGRDHTTILHGTRKIEALLNTDAHLQSEIANLQRQLTPGH